jgi:hypothetical protein
MAVAGAWLSGMPDFLLLLLLLLWDDGRMAPVPMRPSFTGARVEIISERCLWVTSATFGLGGRVSLTATELPSEYLRRCTLARVMAKNFARGRRSELGFAALGARVRAPMSSGLKRQHAEDPRAVLDAPLSGIAKRIGHPAYRGCPFLNLATEFPDDKHPGRIIARRNKEEMRARLAAKVGRLGVGDPDRTASHRSDAWMRAHFIRGQTACFSICTGQPKIRAQRAGEIIAD